MLAIALTRALVPTAGFQEAEEDPLEVLEELIERTNSLQAFKAVFRLHRPGVDEGSVVVFYQSPDRLRMDMRPPGASGESSMLAVAGKLCMLTPDSRNGASFALVDLGAGPTDEPLALELLERRFPASHEGDLGPGPELAVSWRVDPGTEKTDFNLSLSWSVSSRRALLGWLVTMEEEPGLLEVSQAALLQRHERFQASVSRSTGFLVGLAMRGADGSTLALDLEALDLEPELDQALFAIPERPQGARDQSAALERMFAAEDSPQIVRRRCLVRVDRQLAKGRIEWDTQTRDGCEEIFRALHGASIEVLAASWNEKVEGSDAEFLRGIARRRAEGESLEVLGREVAERRAAHEGSIDEGLTSLHDRLGKQELPTGRSGHWRDLLELELRTVEDLVDEHIRRPVMDRFDELAKAALGG